MKNNKRLRVCGFCGLLIVTPWFSHRCHDLRPSNCRLRPIPRPWRAYQSTRRPIYCGINRDRNNTLIQYRRSCVKITTLLSKSTPLLTQHDPVPRVLSTLTVATKQTLCPARAQIIRTNTDDAIGKVFVGRLYQFVRSANICYRPPLCLQQGFPNFVSPMTPTVRLKAHQNESAKQSQNRYIQCYSCQDYKIERAYRQQ